MGKTCKKVKEKKLTTTTNKQTYLLSITLVTFLKVFAEGKKLKALLREQTEKSI
jgi:hypothetical protein